MFHRLVFLTAALYNMSWGVYSAFDPQWFFSFSGLPPTNHPEIFVCLGMLIGLYGILYLDVFRAPERGWLIGSCWACRQSHWARWGHCADMDQQVASKIDHALRYQRFHMVASLHSLPL